MVMGVEPQVVAACSREERLAALRRYGILDTPPEKAFDDIARLVAHVCQAPIALITFVDQGRQWFKSEIGLGVRETPLDASICAHAILQHDLFVVHDATQDERFRDMPVVAGEPHLRFYAGALLQSDDGQPLGTLCVLDYTPRSLTVEQQDALRALARQVMTQLELRRMLAAQAEAARTLELAKQAAEEANRIKDEFLATLSHELRTPLSAISLWAHILQDPAVDSKQLEEGLATIAVSAKAQRKLIEDLLDTSRIAAGKVHLQLDDVDLAALVREAVEGVLPTARGKGVAVETDLRPPVPTVRADADRLRQVLWNLLNNAVKFTPPGGHVRVGVSGQDGVAELCVEDDGEGISADFLPHVFDPFRQADASSTRLHGGLGLGLSIARKLVELHGGTLSVASPGLGRGATFTVRLASRPAAIGEQADEEEENGHVQGPSGDARDGGLHGLHVLLVEDDPATRTAMAAVLRQAGAEVEAVETAAAALAAFRRRRPNVLLSDVGLRDADGYSLIRQIRQAERAGGQRTPAVAVTAFATGNDYRLAVEAGFDTHLPKPAAAEELVEVVSNLSANSASD